MSKAIGMVWCVGFLLSSTNAAAECDRTCRKDKLKDVRAACVSKCTDDATKDAGRTMRCLFDCDEAFEQSMTTVDEPPRPEPVAPPAPNPVRFTLKVRVVVKDDVVAVGGRSFRLEPFDLRKVREELMSRPGVPDDPLEGLERALQSCFDVCLGPECEEICGERYEAKKPAWKAKRSAWRKVAFAGLKEAIAQATPDGMKATTVKTNRKGEATLSLLPGTWFLSGTFRGFDWRYVPVEVTEGMTEFVLDEENEQTTRMF